MRPLPWYRLKDLIAQAFGVSHDVLHVHIGLALFLIGATLLRRSRLWPLYAWTAVLLLELLNETADAVEWIGWTGHANWPESLKDIINTMLWPTVCVVAVLIYRRRRGQKATAEPLSID